MSLHFRVLIFDRLIIYLPIWLFIFISAHCHSMDMEFLSILWFGPPPVTVPHFPLFFCLISLSIYIYIYTPYSESQLEHKSCELSARSYLFLYPMILWSPDTHVYKDTPYSIFTVNTISLLYSALYIKNFCSCLHLLQVFFKAIGISKNIGNTHIEV